MAYKDVILEFTYMALKKISVEHPEAEKTLERINYVRNRLLNKKINMPIFEDFEITKAIMKSIPISDKDKVNFFFDMIEPDALAMKDGHLVISKSLDQYLEQIGINTKIIYQILSLNKTDEEIREMINEINPTMTDKIMTAITVCKQSGAKYKECYRLLKLHYYEKHRKPNLEDLIEIRKALELLEVPEEQISFVIKELKKEVQKKDSIKELNRSKRTQQKVGNDSINWTFEIKKGLSEAEWKKTKTEVEMLYNLDSKIAMKPLDILEKTKLVELLLKLEYKEEEIKEILWQIDEQFPMQNLSNSTQIMRNTRIIQMVLEKAKMKDSNNLEIMDSINEIMELKSLSDLKEQPQWNELLLETIDQENKSITKKLQAMHQELKSIRGNQKSRWREIFLEEMGYEKHSSIVLFQIIFENLKTCPKEERTIWKQRLLDTLIRMQLECTGNYEYELAEAKKIRIKDKK